MSGAPLKFGSPIRDAISIIRFALKSDNVLISSRDLFEILGEFFNDLHTSIRLLRLRGLKPSFSNIYSQIECLTDRYFLLLVILTWQILFLMLPVPRFELIEWRMTEKYCPITAENELFIVSIVHGVLL
ncbi:hypothetical protein D8674_032129 [Pyrus ussuriensis x Pyrus communis]|uniref:Uncharacterized protein n=1 Tax=Pyrus ussuriensis x Pyrus communis TaxID=2448454 RepID=A0A5N5F0P1_9ROSA|nr:hypothetical protein D8674_032129 [Pyrus ussuriensis x Pyrus communis]